MVGNIIKTNFLMLHWWISKQWVFLSITVKLWTRY